MHPLLKNGLWKFNSLKGEGSRIRTYSGVANKFTVCPSSPTLAYPHLNSCRESLDGFCFSLTIYSLWWGRWDSNSRASVLQTVPIALMSAPNTEWHVCFKVKVWLFVICCNHSLVVPLGLEPRPRGIYPLESKSSELPIILQDNIKWISKLILNSPMKF